MTLVNNYMNIGSCNIQGNSNPVVLSKIIKKYHIALLQETNKRTVTILKGLCHKHNMTLVTPSKTAKLVIVVSNEIEIIKKNQLSIDPEESNDPIIDRISQVEIKIKEKNICLINIYQYTNSNVNRQIDLLNVLRNQIPSDKMLLIAGDFNFVLDIQLDREIQREDHQTEHKTREVMKSIIKEFQLVDVYRIRNPIDVAYTNINYFNNRRIDRFHVTPELNSWITDYNHKKWDILPTTTHKILSIQICIQNNPQLKIAPRRKIINDTLIENYQFQQYINLSRYETWKEMSELMTNLAETMVIPKKLQPTSQLNNDVFKDINVRFEYRQKKIQPIMSSLTDTKGNVLTTTDSMLKYARKYMKGMYSPVEYPKESFIPEWFKQREIVKISDEDREVLNAPVTVAELEEELKHVDNDSAPGIDGVTFRCLKSFWKKLGPLLVNQMNEILLTGKLPDEQKQVIIKLIPKSTTSDNIIDLRPISLINTSLRLYSKVMSKRLCLAMKQVWSYNQMGFLPGRSISGAVTKFRYIIDKLQEQNNPYSLLFVDILKAFDNISHQYLIQILLDFGLGPKAINFIEAVTFQHRGMVMINNYKSEDFALLRGVRQGNPISPFVFNIGLQVLLKTIDRHLGKVNLSRGISMNHLAFADDLVVVIHPLEIKKLLIILDDFNKLSNLEVNKKKTKVLTRNPEEYSNLGFEIESIDNNKNSYLGVPISNSVQVQHLNKIANSVNYIIKSGLPYHLRAQGVNSHVFLRLYHADITGGYNQKSINKMATKIKTTLFVGIDWSNLHPSRRQGGFGLINLVDHLNAQRAKTVIKILTETDDETNWHLKYFRIRIQTFIGNTRWLKENNNGARQTYSWYDFLMKYNPELEKAFNNTNFFNKYEKSIISSWFALTKEERMAEEGTRQDARGIKYEYTASEAADQFAMFRQRMRYGGFESYSKKISMPADKSVEPRGWTNQLNITPDVWKSHFKNFHKQQMIYPYSLEEYHRFSLGHYRHYESEREKCKLCGEDYYIGPLDEGQLRRDYTCEHRYKTCRVAKLLWEKIGPVGVEHELNNIVANPSLTGEQMICISRFINAIKILEIKRDGTEDPIDEGTLESWIRQYKYENWKEYFFFDDR